MKSADLRKFLFINFYVDYSPQCHSTSLVNSYTKIVKLTPVETEVTEPTEIGNTVRVSIN